MKTDSPDLQSQKEESKIMYFNSRKSTSKKPSISKENTLPKPGIYQKGFIPDKENIYDKNLEPVKHQLFNTSSSLFITGKAGTGKSTLLREFVDYCDENGINCAVVAPTGIAAINVKGSTIHSMFQLDIHNPTHLKKLNPAKRTILKAIDVLVIDEVSMVSSEIFDLVEKRMNQAKFGDNPHSKRFGGVRVLIFGDIFQLGPVGQDGEDSSKYFFESEMFQSLYQKGNITLLELNKIWRQDDEKFITVLNQIRSGSVDEDGLEVLNSKIINENPQQFARENNFSILCSRNASATSYNNQILAQNPNIEYKFQGKLDGEFNYYDSLPPQELILKKDCLVVFVKNDASKRWVNGDFGLIQGFKYSATMTKNKELKSIEFEDYKENMKTIKAQIEVLEAKGYKLQSAGYSIIIKLTRNNSVVEVLREIWDKKTYQTVEQVVEIDGESMIHQKLTDKTIGRYTQFPIKLGYALTVHKSQGMTLEGAVIDFGSGTFGSGLVYVALSRVKSLANLYLTKKLTEIDIKVDPKVLLFHEIVVDSGLI
jgi:ATP-dependent DNA helicase PIF1